MPWNRNDDLNFCDYLFWLNVLISIAVKDHEIPIPNFMPEFPRQVPRFLESIQDDLDHMWLDLYPHHELIWDYAKDSDSSRELEVKQLMAKALEESLPVGSLDNLLHFLREEPQLIASCEVSSKRFPDLVEKNPQVATEVLLNMMSSPKITEFVADGSAKLLSLWT